LGSANLLCHPYRAYFCSVYDPGRRTRSGRCPWLYCLALSALTAMFANQTLWQSFYYAGITTQQNASAPASYSGSAESAGQKSPGWSEAEPWVIGSGPNQPQRGCVMLKQKERNAFGVVRRPACCLKPAPTWLMYKQLHADPGFARTRTRK
jgi:hypothetical protein